MDCLTILYNNFFDGDIGSLFKEIYWVPTTELTRQIVIGAMIVIISLLGVICLYNLHIHTIHSFLECLIFNKLLSEVILSDQLGLEGALSVYTRLLHVALGSLY